MDPLPATTADADGPEEPELAHLDIQPRHPEDRPSTTALEVATDVSNHCGDAAKKAEASIAVLAVLQDSAEPGRPCFTRLELCEMQIADLPHSMRQLAPRLTHLDLSGNLLQTLPDVIHHLVGLEELQLFGNRLESLPDGLGALGRLQKLLAVGNRLTALPEGLRHNQSLEVLDVEENELTALPDALIDLPKLRAVRAEGNPQLRDPPIEVVRQGVDALRKALRARSAAAAAQ